MKYFVALITTATAALAAPLATPDTFSLSSNLSTRDTPTVSLTLRDGKGGQATYNIPLDNKLYAPGKTPYPRSFSILKLLHQGLS